MACPDGITEGKYLVVVVVVGGSSGEDRKSVV